MIPRSRYGAVDTYTVPSTQEGEDMALTDLTLNANEVCQLFHRVVLPNIPGSFWQQGFHYLDVVNGFVLAAQEPETSAPLIPKDLLQARKRGLIFVRDEADVMLLPDSKAKPVMAIVEEYQPTKTSTAKIVGRVLAYEIQQVKFARYETMFCNEVSFLYRGNGEYQVMLENTEREPIYEDFYSIWRSQLGM